MISRVCYGTAGLVFVLATIVFEGLLPYGTAFMAGVVVGTIGTAITLAHKKLDVTKP